MAAPSKNTSKPTGRLLAFTAGAALGAGLAAAMWAASDTITCTYGPLLILNV